MSNKKAPKGKIWQCQACGKFSLDEYGNESLDYGWDVSCVMNAKLVDAKPFEEKIKNTKPRVSREF